MRIKEGEGAGGTGRYEQAVVYVCAHTQTQMHHLVPVYHDEITPRDPYTFRIEKLERKTRDEEEFQETGVIRGGVREKNTLE